MNKIIGLFLVLTLWTNAAVAGCNWATDVKETPEGNYLYSRECHVEAGKKVRGYSLLEKQVGELEKTIELKDLALSKERQNTQLWMDTSFKMNDKLAAYEATQKASDWLHFGIGVGVTVLSVWAAGQLAK